MSEDVKVIAIKGFNNGDEYARRKTVLTVSEQRARDLERNGLVERTKKAEAPENKKAPEPANKAAAKQSSKKAD